MQARRDETTKIVDENHVLQQAFLNELDEKIFGYLLINSANNLMPLIINISFLVLSF